MAFFFYLFGLFIALGAACMGAASDVRFFRIPNVVSLLVILGFILAYGGGVVFSAHPMPVFGAIKLHIISAVVMFFLTLFLFFARVIGAGDAKFASALALWVPVYPALALFVFYTSLAGGVMGCITLFLARVKPFPSARAGTWVASAQEGQNRIPYGLALTLGFLLTLGKLGFFDITEIINTVENL